MKNLCSFFLDRAFRRVITFVLFALASGLPMFAQDTIDLSGIQNQAHALMLFFQGIGCIAAVAAIIFAALAIRGRNVGEGIVGLVAAIAAIFIIANAQTWTQSITGFTF